MSKDDYQMVLGLGVEEQARALTEHELQVQKSFFSTAERLQSYVAAKLRQLLGEPAYDQRIFTEAERERRVEALMQSAYDAGSLVPKDRHAEWCRMHAEQGWVYGPLFDPKNKRHPNLVPWDELPVEARVKADIFALIATFTSEMFSMAVEQLSHEPKYMQLRVLAHTPLDENDVPEEVLAERLSAVGQLCDGDAAGYTQAVLENAQRILDREGVAVMRDDDYMAAFEEALKGPR